MHLSISAAQGSFKQVQNAIDMIAANTRQPNQLHIFCEKMNISWQMSALKKPTNHSIVPPASAKEPEPQES